MLMPGDLAVLQAIQVLLKFQKMLVGVNFFDCCASQQLHEDHEEDEIQNSKFGYESTKHPSEDPDEDDRKPAAKIIKTEPEDEAQSWAQEEQIEKPTPKPWETRKTMKLYSGSSYLLEKMVKNIMT